MSVTVFRDCTLLDCTGADPLEGIAACLVAPLAACDVPSDVVCRQHTAVIHHDYALGPLWARRYPVNGQHPPGCPV